MSLPWTLPSAVLTISVSGGVRRQPVKAITPNVMNTESLPTNLIFTVEPPDSNLDSRRRQSLVPKNSNHDYPVSSVKRHIFCAVWTSVCQWCKQGGSDDTAF